MVDFTNSQFNYRLISPLAGLDKPQVKGLMSLKAFLFVFCMVTIPVAAFAAESVQITEQTEMNFAQVEIPTSGSKTIIINASTGAYSGTGTVQTGTPARGQYKLRLSGSGSSTSSTIDVQNISSGNAAVTISTFTGNYNGAAISIPQSGLTKPAGGGGTTLYLGATATYTSSVPVGAITPSFDVVVTLQ